MSKWKGKIKVFPNDFKDGILLKSVEKFKMILSKLKLNKFLCFLKCISETKRLECFLLTSKMKFSWYLLRVARWDSLYYLRINSAKFQKCPSENKRLNSVSQQLQRWNSPDICKGFQDEILWITKGLNLSSFNDAQVKRKDWSVSQWLQRWNDPNCRIDSEDV